MMNTQICLRLYPLLSAMLSLEYVSPLRMSLSRLEARSVSNFEFSKNILIRITLNAAAPWLQPAVINFDGCHNYREGAPKWENRRSKTC